MLHSLFVLHPKITQQTTNTLQKSSLTVGSHLPGELPFVTHLPRKKLMIETSISYTLLRPSMGKTPYKYVTFSGVA